MGDESKPTAAFVLSLMAGIFILLNGLYLVVIGAIFAFVFLAIGFAIAIIGLIFGILVLLGAIMMYSKPRQTKAWSAIVLVFSIISIVIGGGFIIGFILGIVGGAIGLSWKPEKPKVEEEQRTCLSCGRLYPVKYNNCPYCGAVPGARGTESAEINAEE